VTSMSAAELAASARSSVRRSRIGLPNGPAAT
jgi:hypothetical protein